MPHKGRRWGAHRSSLANQTIVTKLQSIRIKTKPLYIGRQKKGRY